MTGEQAQRMIRGGRDCKPRSKCVEDNQGRCHTCGRVMNLDSYRAYFGAKADRAND